MNSASIVSKVWSFCTTLRDNGVGYGDYLKQLTYLIFLKMAGNKADYLAAIQAGLTDYEPMKGLVRRVLRDTGRNVDD